MEYLPGFEPSPSLFSGQITKMVAQLTGDLEAGGNLNGFDRVSLELARTVALRLDGADMKDTPRALLTAQLQNIITQLRENIGETADSDIDWDAYLETLLAVR